MSKHLKRLFAPKTWKIKRKGIKYIAKPSPGPHNQELSLPINVIMRSFIGNAQTNRQVKYILNKKSVVIDGKQRKDYRFPVGLFDVITFPDTKESYRVILDSQGKLDVISTKEPTTKLVKISGKKSLKGKMQLNLADGKNLLIDKGDYSVGDSVLLSFDKKLEIKDHIKLDKGSLIFLTGGKHIGQTGTVEDIDGRRIIYKTDKGDVVETLKRYAFPIGKDKPLITIKGK